MDKPKNKAQLIRFLPNNPYLRWTHPSGMVQTRKFNRMLGGRFGFITPKGSESFFDAKAKAMRFDDDGFDVVFEEGWGDLAGKAMRYEYINEATYNEETKKVA